jgi:hypothetical protein
LSYWDLTQQVTCPQGYLYNRVSGRCEPAMDFTHDALETIEEESRNIFEEFKIGVKEANKRAEQDLEEPPDEWRILNWPTADIVANDLGDNQRKLDEYRKYDHQNIGMMSGNFITPSKQHNPAFMTALIKSLKRIDYDEITLEYRTENPVSDKTIKVPHKMRIFLHEVFEHVENEMKLYEEDIASLRKYEMLFNKNKKWISLDQIAKTYEIGLVLEAVENNKMDQKLLKSKSFNDFCNYMANGDIEALKANVKACNLIHEWLDSDEWNHLVQKHEVVIKSSKHKNRYYLIRENAQDRVIVIENGVATKELCGIVTEHDPKTYEQLVNGDQLLTKIITIKTDEQHYLENSNESSGSGRSYPEYRLGRGLKLRLSGSNVRE